MAGTAGTGTSGSTVLAAHTGARLSREDEGSWEVGDKGKMRPGPGGVEAAGEGCAGARIRARVLCAGAASSAWPGRR